jgi:hypothetical protein
MSSIERYVDGSLSLRDPAFTSARSAAELLGSLSRNDLAHRRAARAIDAYRAYEAQSDAIFRELTIALEEQLAVNHVGMKPEKNKWMTEAYREWQVQEQVKKERRA